MAPRMTIRIPAAMPRRLERSRSHDSFQYDCAGRVAAPSNVLIGASISVAGVWPSMLIWGPRKIEDFVGFSCVSDPWIEHGVQHVSEQVARHDEERGEERDAHRRAVVVLE